MSGGDCCAVYGCSNDKRKPGKGIVIENVGKVLGTVLKAKRAY